MTAELQQARQARRILEKLHRKLLLPKMRVLDHGLADLTVAAQFLQRLEVSLAQGYRTGLARQALELELAGVRRELQTVQALVSSAGRFYEGWARLISAEATAGLNYTAEGQVASAPSPQPTGVVLHG